MAGGMPSGIISSVSARRSRSRLRWRQGATDRPLVRFQTETLPGKLVNGAVFRHSASSVSPSQARHRLRDQLALPPHGNERSTAMRLPSAHFRRLLDDDPETRRLLDATDDALVRSNALMRQTFVALGRSRREN